MRGSGAPDFQRDPKIVGRVARINNRTVTIVGVVPDRTSLWVQPTGVWLPYTSQPYFDPEQQSVPTADYLWLNLAGRLTPGFTRAPGTAEFGGLARQLDYLRARPAHRD